MSTDDPPLTADHWVSRGYQANFANAQGCVAILDVRGGRIVDARRAIKSNFREVGFTTFLDAGVPNDLLERAFAAVERSVLRDPNGERLASLSQAEGRVNSQDGRRDQCHRSASCSG